MSFVQESQPPNLEYSESNLVYDDGDEKGTINDSFTPERVFLSNIDSYHGRHIATAIARKISRNEENDLDEIEEAEERSSGNDNSVHHRLKYEIIGSVTVKDFPIPNHVEEIIDNNEKSKILEKILSCKFVIYDISEDTNQVDEAAWAIKALDEEFNKNISNGKEMLKTDEPINYILISTVLTWAKTKPIDPNEPDVPITEDDYRMRKPHSNYKLHFDLEKEVIRIGKKHKKVLKTIVVASGLVYGVEENLMGILFKLAWMSEPCPYLPPGKNMVPLLHINDLASIICNLMESMPKKKWYIIAIEETAPTSKEIVKAISKELGTGELCELKKDAEVPMKEINMELYDHLTVDLNMSPKYILENMDLDHIPDDMNFLNIMKETVSNFIESHGLKAIKIFINGPPLSGKTFLSNKLCSYYQLHYLSYDTIIEDFCNRMNKLKKKSSMIKSGEEGVNESENEEENIDEDKDGNEVEEDDVLNEEYENELLEIFQQLEEAKINDTIPDQDVTNRIIKEKLLSKPCQNQGYVLDGYPDTYDQAKNLFCINEDENEKEEEDEEEEDGKEEEDDEAPLPFVVDKKIIPDHVFNLIADDAILLYRGNNTPPEREMDNHYNEESLKKSIFDFRVKNSDVSTVMNFFLEVDKYPIDISVNNDERPFLEKSFKEILKQIGKPGNFGKEDGTMSKEEEALLLLQKEELLQEELKKLYEEKLDRRAKLEEWVIALSLKKKEEEDLLRAKTLPIRDYILKEIFPFLKVALVEIHKIKPRDPVDYLAEYLFTHYVDGKCFPSESNEVTEDEIWASLAMANTSRMN